MMDFQQQQAAFSAYIRNPELNPCPHDVAPDRMQMYRELFFNNVESFLSSNFPVLHKILPSAQWIQLAQDFFEQHPCTTPYFAEIPEEFLLYLQNERPTTETDYPFLLELAHYEWVEMALSVAQDTLSEQTQQAHTLCFTDTVSLSPLAWPLAYQFPVHKIAPEYLPLQALEQPSYLVVYRDSDDEVHFIELAPMSFQLLQHLQEKDAVQVSDYLAELLAPDANEALQTGALAALQQFMNKQVIIHHPTDI